MLAQLETVLRSDVDENEIIQFFFFKTGITHRFSLLLKQW